MSFERGDHPYPTASPHGGDKISGYTVYQGSGRHKQIPGLGRTTNSMAGKPSKEWHPMYGPEGDARQQQYDNRYSNPKYIDPSQSNPSNDNGEYSGTMGQGPIPGRNSGSPNRGIAHLISVYSDKSSISGVPFIKNTKYKSVRAIWSILLLAAVVAMGFHLSKLITTFFEYKTQIKLDLNFSHLSFPAVTICNTNAVRYSQLDLASEDLRTLVRNVDPDRLRDMIKSWVPEYEDATDDFYEDFDEDEDYSDDGDEAKRRRKREAVTVTTRKVKAKLRTTNFLDDIDTNSSDWYDGPEEFDYDEDDDSLESETERSAFDKIEEDFIYFYSLMNSSARFQMGHQIQDMLMQCSFKGRKCYQANFTVVPSSVYGNCFTLQYDKYVVRESGPAAGLELIVFLDTTEYIPGITNSKGLQVVIHQPNSVAFPEDEGFGVSARTNTFIGLRQIDVSRKGSPYGDCTDTSDFFKKYKKVYTRQTCQKLCLQNSIRDRCQCYDRTSMSLNKILTIPKGLKPCKSADKLECVYEEKQDFKDFSYDCGCHNPCTETDYRRSVSMREWPNPAFTTVIAAMKCKEYPNLCPIFANMSEENLQSEFLKLTIYFEDLNHETIEEEPDYEEFQLMSDVGGTIGLWIGLSVLSICETFHLLIAMCRYMCCGNWRKKNG